MSFIVIEGLDGSGKTTQLNLVKEYLEKRKVKSRFLHFPRHDSPFFGELISRFLRGELGKIDEVDPYLVALLYAGDRKDASDLINGWFNEGYVVIADRYLYSNIAFQCAKIKNLQDKDKLAKWIKSLEYDYNQIPKPTLNLFLKVPFSFTQQSLDRNRTGTDRDYLKGAEDIHEASLDFQRNVREVYLWQIEENEDFELIDCSNADNKMLSPSEIFSKIEKRLDQTLKI